MFFYGSRQLCRQEIADYQRLDISRRMAWKDVSFDDVIRRPDTASRFCTVFTQLSVVPQCAERIANFWSVTSLMKPLYRAFLPFRPRLQRKARVS